MFPFKNIYSHFRYAQTVEIKKKITHNVIGSNDTRRTPI